MIGHDDIFGQPEISSFVVGMDQFLRNGCISPFFEDRYAIPRHRRYEKRRSILPLVFSGRSHEKIIVGENRENPETVSRGSR